MSPIRVGIFGLSTTGWACNAHLPYLKQSEKYKVVGICNSSKESGETAIRYHSLPSSTKAYGSPQELADDPDVDLVVTSVRVDRHAQVVRPALEKGKACFVEWPLERNLDEALQLYDLAKNNGSRTMVGLQARRSPVVNTVKAIIERGSIGRILSSTVLSSAGNMGASDTERVEYFNHEDVGGNIFTIHFAHMLDRARLKVGQLTSVTVIDYVLYTLGELDSFSSTMSTQRPESKIVDSHGQLLRSVVRETADHVTLQGQLRDGGILSVYHRGGLPFKDEPGLIWRIYGDKGEIQVTADGIFLQIGYPNMVIKLHDHASGTIEVVDWTPLAHHQHLPLPARNVAALYEAFADGKTADYVQWDEAVARHKLLSDIRQSAASGLSVKAGQ